MIKNEGLVCLVGAGPGDPRLLTLRGAELLANADVVVYDALANPQLLERCPNARKIYVGKQAARHALPQDQINALLIEQARAGKRVVRLKGGDPFVFGRGGEECEALADAGVRFEVVPGVTAGIAAAAYAGIPITHRDLNSSFIFVTGHEREESYEESSRAPGGASDLDWAVLAKQPALAFYMGVKSLGRICQKLIENGMSAQMPAAVIHRGTTPRQLTIVATIADIAAKVEAARLSPPALTIVGQVVTLRERLNWFETRPLFGQTVVVTRTRQQASALSNRLGELGANVIEAPTIELIEPADWSAVDEVLRSISAFDWVIFTSANGVQFARRRLCELALDARAFAKVKIAAIGAATAQAVRDQLFLSVDLCPKSFVAEALADELLQRKAVNGSRFLLLRADIARPLLREQLLAGGAAEVRDVPIYQTTAATELPSALVEALAAGQVDWITFTSSSTAKNFAQLLGPDYRQRLGKVKIASIGPITSATLRDLGLDPTVEASSFDIEGVVKAIVDSENVPTS